MNVTWQAIDFNARPAGGNCLTARPLPSISTFTPAVRAAVNACAIESPVKSDFRLARRSTTVAGVEIDAGTPVMLLNGAANRDPRHFERPGEFRLDRANAKAHLAFGRGVHSCPGGPLARAEGRVSIERILDRMRDIRLSEELHGPPSARHFEYEPTWVLRGLHKLHIEFTPAGASR